MIKTVIFDFDGTLCDNFQEMLTTFGDVARREGVSFGDETEEIVRNQGTKAFFMSLKVEPERVKYLLIKVRQGMLDIAGNLKLFAGVNRIETLKNGGIKVGIISSSPVEYINRVLQANSVGFFDFVIFEDNVFGKDKTLVEFIENNGLEPDEVAYAGDEDRDVEAANKAGVESVAVTWGYNSEELLLASKPKKIVHTFEELIDLFI